MSTLRDVHAWYQGSVTQIALFGGKGLFCQEFQRRWTALEETILREIGVPPEKASELSPDTVLSPTAEQRFTELQQWWEQHQKK